MASNDIPLAEMPGASDKSAHETFYTRTGSIPELGRYRKFGMLWTKRVYDETSKLRAALTALNDEFPKYPELDGLYFLDCPFHIITEKCPKGNKKYKRLYAAWRAYEKALEQYGRVLCLSQQVMEMPTQDEHNAKAWHTLESSECKPIFDKDIFGPTGEGVEWYLGHPQSQDTCVWRAIPDVNILTSMYLRLSPWIERRILVRWRRHQKGQRASDQQENSYVQLGWVASVVDTVSCVLASLALAASVAILAVVQSFKARLGLLALFGAIFSFLLRLVAGRAGLKDVFGATAAFYAVGVVFLSSTDGNRAI